MNKSELLSGLQEEYRRWQTLLEEIGVARMDTPGVAGSWSIKDIIAHITGWRRRTVARLQALQRGEPEPPPPWPADLQTDDDINDWIYESRRSASVGEVLDESDRVFQELLTAIEGLPEDVLTNVHRVPWLEGQPLTASRLFAHFREEHESDMRAWLERTEKQ